MRLTGSISVNKHFNLDLSDRNRAFAAAVECLKQQTRQTSDVPTSLGLIPKAEQGS